MSLFARLLALLFTGYQKIISPLFPARCRFHPTCSEYALQAVRGHGAVKGLWLALRRIGRCHPWHEGGLDPVPTREPALVSERQSA